MAAYRDLKPWKLQATFWVHEVAPSLTRAKIFFLKPSNELPTCKKELQNLRKDIRSERENGQSETQWS